MTDRLARDAGSAFFWQGLQHAGVKGIFLLRTLVLARLLFPEDFGLYAISLIGVGVLRSLTNLGLMPALIQRRDLRGQHYDVAWTLQVLRAGFIGLVVSLAAPLIANLLSEPEATDLIRVAAFHPLLRALASIKISDLNRELRFRSLALLSLLESVLNTVVSILLAVEYGPWALLLGLIAGLVTRSVVSYIIAPYRPRFSFDRQSTGELVQFGRWIMLVGILSMGTSALLQAYISRQLGVAALGLYFLAAKLAFIPAEIGGEVIGAVSLPLFAQLQSNLDHARRAFQSILKGVWALLLPATFLLIALAPSIVAEVLGERWHGTAPLIRLLALASAVGLFGDVIVPVLQGTGRPQKQFFLEIVQSAVILVSAVILGRLYGVVGVAGGWVLGVSASQIAGFSMVRQIIPGALGEIWKPAGIIGAVTIISVTIAYIVETLLPGPLGPVAAGILGLGLAGMFLLTMDRRHELGLAKTLVAIVPQLKPILP